MNYYCIPSCDKCRAARKILRDQGVSHREIDMRKEGISKEMILSWVEKFGLETILNRKSATWRGLDEDTKARIETSPFEVIMSNPAMLHRPILEFGEELKIGKDALEWLALQKA